MAVQFNQRPSLDLSQNFRQRQADEQVAAAGFAKQAENFGNKLKEEKINEVIKNNTNPETGELNQGSFISQLTEIDPQMAMKYRDYFDQHNQAVEIHKSNMAKTNVLLKASEFDVKAKEHQYNMEVANDFLNRLAGASNQTVYDQIVKQAEDIGQDVKDFKGLNYQEGVPKAVDFLRGYIGKQEDLLKQSQAETNRLLSTTRAEAANTNAEASMLRAQTGVEKLDLDRQKWDSKKIIDQQKNELKEIQGEAKQGMEVSKLQVKVGDSVQKINRDKRDMENDKNNFVTTINKNIENNKRLVAAIANVRDDSTLKSFSNSNAKVAFTKAASGYNEQFADLTEKIKTLTSIKFVEAAQFMRGMGALSDRDAKAIESIFGTITPEMSYKEANNVLNRLSQSAASQRTHLIEDYNNFDKMYVNFMTESDNNIKLIKDALTAVQPTITQSSNMEQLNTQNPTPVATAPAATTTSQPQSGALGNVSSSVSPTQQVVSPPGSGVNNLTSMSIAQATQR